MTRNTAGQTIGAQMVSAADGSEFTGAVTVYVTIDGGTQAAGSVGAGACAHEGHGYHTYAPSQAETDGALLAFTFVGTGAVTATVQAETTPTPNDIADAVLKRDWTQVTGEAARSLLNAVRFLRNKWGIATGTLTVTKEDDATTAWTAAVTNDAAATPVTGSDPS